MKKVVKKQTIKQEAKCCCKDPKKVLYVHIAALVLVIASIFCVYFKYGVVASVNGKMISRMTYVKKLEKNDAKQLLEQMVTEALIEGEAVKNKVIVEQAVVDAEIKKIEEQIVAQGQTLDAALTSRGMIKADLEGQIKMQKMVEKMSAPAVEITQAQIDEFLKTNKAQLPTKATKDELQQLAKDELTSQAKDSAITTWLEKIRSEAKITFR